MRDGAPMVQHAQSGDHELDLPALRRSLAALGREVQQAQARVVATIEAKHVEFVAASEQVSDLRSAVSRLRSDLKSAAVLLGKVAANSDEAVAVAGGTGDATGATALVPAAQSPVPRLRTAVAEHKALKEDLRALEAASGVLSTMLEAQRKLTELDALTASARYNDAAELSLEIAQALQGISARDANQEPAMVRAAKMQYYQKRAILVSRLEEALGRLVAFGEGPSAVARRSTVSGGSEDEAEEATARRPVTSAATTLQQVWDALQVLDLRSRRVEQLAEQAHRKVLTPLLEAARRLPQGRELRPSASFDTTLNTITWRWVEADDDGVGIENIMPEGNILPRGGGQAVCEGRSRLVQCVLPSLESLFQFMYENWTGGLSEVFAALGKRLWPPVARNLVRHFDTCSRDGGEALERFEAAMLKGGLIKSAEKTLSRHVHQHRHALGEQRRASVLAEARQWLLQEDGSLVEVCDADEPGSVTQLLEQRLGEEPRSSPAPPEVSDGFACEKLQHTLREDAGLLRLPTMHVSIAVRRLVNQLRALLEEAVQAVEQGRSEVANDLNKLMRELCTLFAVLRPYAQKVQLKTNARYCAVFLADCLYLVHVLILMPYTYGKRLPQEHRQLSFFVDLVPQLRRLGENHFFAMLRHHQDQLASAMKPCDLGAGISRDRTFIAAEAALGAAAQQTKLAVQGLSAALPAQLLREVAGVMVGVIGQNLLGKLFSLQHMAPEEVSCVTALLTSALAMGRQCFAAAGLADGGGGGGRPGQDSMDDDIPGWAALSIVTDLLGSGFPRFLEKRRELTKALKREDALRLMQLSWQDEALSPEEAWDVLAAGSGD